MKLLKFGVVLSFTSLLVIGVNAKNPTPIKKKEQKQNSDKHVEKNAKNTAIDTEKLIKLYLEFGKLKPAVAQTVAIGGSSPV